jgi:hypothetical protein
MTTMSWTIETQTLLESVGRWPRRFRALLASLRNQLTDTRREWRREKLSEEAQHCEDLQDLRSRENKE